MQDLKEEKTGKAKKERTPMPEQPAEERRKNFNEVALGYTKEDALSEASRCLACKEPECVEGCPVNVDIPGFIKLICEEDFDRRNRENQSHKYPSCHLRPRLPPGDPV